MTLRLQKPAQLSSLQVRHKVETVLIVLLVLLLGDGAHRCPARRKLIVENNIQQRTVNLQPALAIVNET